MRKVALLSVLICSFVVAAVSRVEAAPVCTTVNESTPAGSFTGELCIDLAAGTIDLTGTAT